MIPLEMQRLLREELAKSIKDPVKIDLFTQRPLALTVPGREECATCVDTQALLTDLARLHPKLHLTVHERGADRALEQRLAIEHLPAIVLRGVLNRPAVFFGEPGGVLFEPFVEAILVTSRNSSTLPAEVTRPLKRLRDPVRVRLFVEQDSQPCVPMALAAFGLAIESKQVRLSVYRASEFPRLVERFGVRVAPFTIFDDRSAFEGAVEPNVFVANLLKAVQTRAAVALPRGTAGTPLPAPQQPQQGPRENVRPSGLIVPGR